MKCIDCENNTSCRNIISGQVFCKDFKSKKELSLWMIGNDKFPKKISMLEGMKYAMNTDRRDESIRLYRTKDACIHAIMENMTYTIKEFSDTVYIIADDGKPMIMQIEDVMYHSLYMGIHIPMYSTSDDCENGCNEIPIWKVIKSITD